MARGEKIPHIKTDANKHAPRKGQTSQDTDAAETKIGAKPERSREILSPKGPNVFPRTTRTPHRERSVSPTRDEARYLPNSYARCARELSKKTIRESPSFDDFRKANRPKAVTMTYEQYQALQIANAATMDQIMEHFYATGWDVLQAPIPYQDELPGLSRANSNYDNTFIDLNDLRPWSDFPTFDDIERFVKNNSTLNQSICKIKLLFAGKKPWYEEELGDDGTIPATDENSLTRNHQRFFSQLSGLLLLACNGAPDDKFAHGLSNKGSWIKVGGGKCGMKRRDKGVPNQKVPDLVSFWTKGKDSHLAAKKGKPHPALKEDCLIVGDFKCSTKFNHSMLIKRPGVAFNPEGQKVVYQIHDYMDMHHNRFGYIIGNNELIMFRRRDYPPQAWGQLDFSDAIPLNTGRGQLNGMMVLFYFHVKYVVLGEDGGWMLPSTYHNCPEEYLGTSVGAVKKVAVKR